jgi:hypothetical protein
MAKKNLGKGDPTMPDISTHTPLPLSVRAPHKNAKAF